MKILFFVIFSLISLFSFSQKQGVYWIQFTDKLHSSYSISNADQFLSQRAISRRVRQNIAVNALDIPVSLYYIDSLRRIGLTAFNSSKWLNGILVKVTDTTMLTSLAGVSFVQSFKYVRPIVAKKSLFPKKDLGTISDDYDYGTGFNQISMLNGNVLHNLGFKGEGMLIAIVDAGFIGANTSAAFDSLFSNNRVVSTRDFATGNNDTTVFESATHGTSVLSTIASLIPGSFVGTAPRASVSLILSEEAASEYVFEEYTWVCAAEYADSIGADILSSSLGYTVFDDPSMNHTWSDLTGNISVASKAAKIASGKGMIVVVSAGNSGDKPWHKIGIPSDADSILCVGAVNSFKQPAPFTSVGYSADGRIKPDVAAMGWGTTIVDGGGNVTQGSGTSFSCPIIAGMCACLWQAHPNATNMEIRDAVIKSSSQFLTPDTLLGNGIPDFAKANLLLSNIPIVNINSDQIKNVYPIPFTSYIYIEFYSAKCNEVEVELTDMLGNLIVKTSSKLILNSLNIINLTNLKTVVSGSYILKIKTETDTFKRMIVKK